jgi:hypothetical protein
VLGRFGHLAERVTHRPTILARQHIFGQHRLAVVKLEARSQPQGPHKLIGGHLLGFDHLAMTRLASIN